MFIGHDFSFFNTLCFLFFLPIFINFVIIAIGNIITCLPVSPDVVGSDVVVENDDATMATMQAELESVKKQLSKLKSKPELKSKKQKQPKSTKYKEMMEEVAISLNNLGIKKSKANHIVNELCKEKTYNSSEDLLQDAIVYIG